MSMVGTGTVIHFNDKGEMDYRNVRNIIVQHDKVVYGEIVNEDKEAIARTDGYTESWINFEGMQDLYDIDIYRNGEKVQSLENRESEGYVADERPAFVKEYCPAA